MMLKIDPHVFRFWQAALHWIGTAIALCALLAVLIYSAPDDAKQEEQAPAIPAATELAIHDLRTRLAAAEYRLARAESELAAARDSLRAIPWASPMPPKKPQPCKR